MNDMEEWKTKLRGLFNMGRGKKKRNKKRKKIFDMGRSNMVVNFVHCPNEKCMGRWNPELKKSCPICGRVPIGPGKTTTTSNIMPKTAKIKSVVFQDEAWETEIDCVDSCSNAPENIVIWMRPVVKEKIDFLMKKFRSIEWLAYLIGKDFIVEDIFIPSQRVSSARVDDVDCPEFNDLEVMGVMHSHHGMGTGFSGTDHEWINQNHDISIVIANTGAAGQVRWKTPCGSIKIVDASVKLKLDTGVDLESFEKDVDEKIKQGFVRQVYQGHHNTGFQVAGQKTFAPGVAISSRTMPNNDDKDSWNTKEDDPKELNFTEEKTLAEELEELEDSNMYLNEPNGEIKDL